MRWAVQTLLLITFFDPVVGYFPHVFGSMACRYFFTAKELRACSGFKYVWLVASGRL